MPLLFLIGCAFDGSGLDVPPSSAPPPVDEVDAGVPTPDAEVTPTPTPTPDPTPTPPPPPTKRKPGEPCDRDEQCASNACVSGRGKGPKECAQPCDDEGLLDCPLDAQCKGDVCRWD